VELAAAGSDQEVIEPLRPRLEIQRQSRMKSRNLANA
jgi:hypothetical protein